jgi:general secretion pathway protein L
MAHTIVGIDLGSHAVKFALVEAGFRQSRALEFFAEPVVAGEAPLAERQGEALRRGLERLGREATLYLAMPGELLTLRVLDLPFSDPRKIEQVVGYELEGQIVNPLSEMVFDHHVLDAPGPEGTAVMAVAARIEDVGALLADLGVYGLDPRALYPAPLVYDTLLQSEEVLVEGGVPPCRVVVDVGHLRTNVCVLQGNESVFARTILRGGAALTTAIAQAYHCEEGPAEELKRSFGLSPARPSGQSGGESLATVLGQALSPLLRDLRQTLASVRARVRTPIESVLLTGGSARLLGLAEYLTDQLGLPVSIWDGGLAADVPHVDEEPTLPTSRETRFALASAVAWAGVRGAKQIDLRRGPFTYKASLSILRQKALHLGALAAAVLLCVTVDATMALARLRGERDQLQARLRSQTQELFGEPRLDGRQVATLLKRSFKDEMAPIPIASAYDLLGEISRRVPPADKIKLDITDLEIKPKKVFIRGTVETAAAVDELQEKLEEAECFEEVTKGPVVGVSGGAKSFTLTIASKC